MLKCFESFTRDFFFFLLSFLLYLHPPFRLNVLWVNCIFVNLYLLSTIVLFLLKMNNSLMDLRCFIFHKLMTSGRLLWLLKQFQRRRGSWTRENINFITFIKISELGGTSASEFFLLFYNRLDQILNREPAFKSKGTLSIFKCVKCEIVY